MRVLQDAGDACLWASSVMIVAWVIQYSVLAPWWDNPIGITIVGEALCLLAIFVPSLLALADPAAFATFAQQTWYTYLTIGVVAATAVFLGTRIVTWELIRRRRGTAGLPNGMAARITELETENARLRAEGGH